MSVYLRVLLCTCALSAPLLASSAAAQQPLLVLGAPGDSAIAYGSETGRVLTFICPDKVTTLGDVWGTGVYYHQSAICSAAVHAGRHTLGQTTRVTIRIGGAADLQGTESRGVTSRGYRSAAATYTFVDNTETAQIDWNTTFDRAPDGLAPLTVRCPPNVGGSYASVIGFGVHRSDSGICAAGVQAGVITLADGGLVMVTFQPRQQSLASGERNGIRSAAWSDATYLAYPPPFSVTPGAVAVTAPSAPAARGLAVGAPAAVVAAPETAALGRAAGAPAANSVTVRVDVATATVTWTPVAGAQGYLVTRWKVGDPNCCNNVSPPGVPITGTQWVDSSPLRSAGTYGYRVYATTAAGIVATEATVVWNGVENPGVQSATAAAPSAVAPAAAGRSAPAAIAGADAPPPPNVAGAPGVPSPPPQGALPPNAGRYRVMLVGALVGATTKDSRDNSDGIGDEILGAAVTVHWDRRTNVVQRRAMVVGREYGDIRGANRAPDRIQAGRGGGPGGLLNNNVVPDNYVPGQPHGTPSGTQFPLIVWQGTLVDGIDAVLVMPSLWERDSARAAMQKYEAAWLNDDVTEVLRIASAQVPLPQLTMMEATVNPGPPTYFTVVDLANNLIDRPLGLTVGLPIARYHDRFVVVTREKLRELATVGSTTNLSIRYAESTTDPILGADYTLELRVERLE